MKYLKYLEWFCKVLDELEITGIVKDNDGIISHYDVKGYGIHSVELIEKLIMEDACSFFIHDGEKKMNVYARTSPNRATHLTTDPNGSGINRLNFLPLFDGYVFRQLIESVR